MYLIVTQKRNMYVRQLNILISLLSGVLQQMFLVYLTVESRGESLQREGLRIIIYSDNPLTQCRVKKVDILPVSGDADSANGMLQ
jgi:hypothetical protein